MKRHLTIIVPVVAAAAACTVAPARSAPVSIERSMAPTAVSSPAEPSPTDQALSGTAAAGPYRLTLELPKRIWRASEVLTGEASLVGHVPGQTRLCASGGGIVGFDYREIGGTRHMEPVMQANEKSYPFTSDVPIEVPVRKSGASSGDIRDPDVDFYRTWMQDPLVHLPPGDWEVTVQARFSDGPTCDTWLEIDVPLQFTVTP